MLHVGQRRLICGEQEHLCSTQGCVAGGYDALRGKLQQSDADGAGSLYVVAESASEMNAFEILRLCAQGSQQQSESSSNGGLGQLQFANIRLIQNHRTRDREES